MKTVTWQRTDGYHLVILFDNGKSGAEHFQGFSTRKGAEKFGEQVHERYGSDWMVNGRRTRLAYTKTDPETGAKQTLWEYHNFLSV